LLVDVDYSARVAVAANLCSEVNQLGGTQIPVPSQAGTYDHPSTLIWFLRAAAAAVGIPVPTDNLDYTHFVPLANAVIGGINAAAQPAMPANTILPAMSGSIAVPGPLQCTNGTWTPPGVAFTRQWKRGTTNVGTGANSYVLSAADETFMISCVVTGTNEAGSVQATSNAVGPIVA
jgi:hypothetical protein